MEPIIKQAIREAHEKKIHGKDVTPFLLQRISELTEGKSMAGESVLAAEQPRLAAQIATALRNTERRTAGHKCKTDFRISEIIPAKPAEIYMRLVEQSGSHGDDRQPCQGGRNVGGEFSAWDGYIFGQHLWN